MNRENQAESDNGGIDVEQTCKLAHQRLLAGEVDAAQEIFHQVLKVSPEYAPALHFLGLTYSMQGNLAEAVVWVRQAVTAAPGYTQARANLACLLAEQGRWEESAAAAGRAIQLDPNMAGSRIVLARALAHLGRHAEVDQIVRGLSQAGKHDEEIAILKDIIEARPNDVRYLEMLGLSYITLGQFAPAAGVYERAVALAPDSAKLWNQLGAAAGLAMDVRRGLEAFEKAVELDPSNSRFHLNLGMALMDLDKHEQALREMDKSIEIQPDHVEAHVCRASLNLLLGKMREGWDESEWRRKLGNAVAITCPGREWDGGDPRGKRLLVHWEQGFGDIIQFARFLPVLAHKGARVIFFCQPRMQRLLGSLKGIDSVVTLERGESATYDAWIAMGSLPRLFGTAMDSLPRETPYLWPPEEDCVRWRERLAGDRSFRVGLIWATASGFRARMSKSIPAQTAIGLLDVPGVTFYSLLVDASAGDLAVMGDRIIDLSPELKDFAVTAAVMKQMDLIITIDTATAHLAGAIGVPVWILLQSSADWRWLVNRSDSPWYPTARLFRQPSPGDWKSVVFHVRRELAARAQSKWDCHGSK
jgi:tetratricopeptide (TPR) repeat protein